MSKKNENNNRPFWGTNESKFIQVKWHPTKFIWFVMFELSEIKIKILTPKIHVNSNLYS